LILDRPKRSIRRKLGEDLGYALFTFLIFINIAGWIGVSLSKMEIPETNVAYRSVIFLFVLMGIVTLSSMLLGIGYLFVRKKVISHKQLLVSEREQMVSILDSINEFIYISDPITYKILYANKTVRDLFGENLVGEICYKKLQGFDVPCRFCTNEKILKDKKKPYKWEYHNPVINQDFLITDKIIQWSDGNDVRFELAINITAQKRIKQIDEVLQRSNNIEKVMKDVLDVVLTIFDCGCALLLCPEGSQTRHWNVKFEKCQSDIQVLEDSAYAFFNSSICQNIFEECLNSEGQVFTKIADNIGSGGEAKPTLLSTMQMAILSEKDKPWILCIQQFNEERTWTEDERVLFKEIGHRISESLNRLRLYNELKRNEEKYRMLFDSIKDGVNLVDSLGMIVECSASTCEFLGYSKDEIIGKHLIDFLAPDCIDIFAVKFPLLMDLQSVEAEIQLVKKDKTIIDIWRIGLPLKDTNGNFSGALLYDRDITIRKQLQKQLVWSERLSATGQLAASIAHEINSPLQAISFMLDTIKNGHRQDVELSENIELLKGSFNSIRDTVRNLLDLNRPGQEKRQPVKINNIIEKTVALFQNQLKKSRIKTNLNLSFKVPVIQASPQLLSQVFLNLTKNAVEAMSGKLKKESSYSTDTREINIKSNLKKGNIIIRFSDSGVGISAGDLNRVFDPFYTRKKAMGLGVGLSICHDIIKDHGGNITVENSPEGGALFTIILPVI